MNALPAADEAFKIEWQQLGFCRARSVGRAKVKALVATVQRNACVTRESLFLRHSSPQHTCCGLVFYSIMFLDLYKKIEIGHIEKSLSEKRKIITIHYTIEV